MTVIGDAGIAVGLRVTRFLIRRLGFRRTISLLGRISLLPAQKSPATASVTGWSERINRVAGRPYGATCLDRSVFLWWLMCQRGLDGQLRIGVAFDGDRLDGHAWVEIDGVVVNDDPQIVQQFAVFDEDPTGVVFR